MKRIHDKLGTAGLIVAVVALVAALGGSAIAANTATDSGKRHKRANKKKKQKGVTVAQVRKIAKQEARKYANSNPGPAGPQGPAGSSGPKGDTGSAGSDGSNGTNGAPGATGKSVVFVDDEPAGCPAEEGITYEIEDSGQKDEVCDGEQGEEGSPWTAGGTLPEGATLTGSFTAPSGVTPTFEPTTFYTQISFGIRLANPPTPVVVKAGQDKSAEGCSAKVKGSGSGQGTLEGGIPLAAKGTLCIYLSASNIQSSGEFVTVYKPDLAAVGSPEGLGTSSSGALLELENEISPVPVHGTWAVGGDTPLP